MVIYVAIAINGGATDAPTHQPRSERRERHMGGCQGEASSSHNKKKCLLRTSPACFFAVTAPQIHIFILFNAIMSLFHRKK